MKGVKIVEVVDYVKKNNFFPEVTCFLKQVGVNMRGYRKNKKLTQTQIAKALHMAFISYNNIERGIVGTTLRTLFKIAKVLEVSLAQLLLDKGDIFLTKRDIISLYTREGK